MTGVYCITNLINGKRYVGSASKSFAIRIRTHITKLQAGQHPNIHLQRSWIKHGPNCFRFSILVHCPPEDCVSQEQRFIDQFQSSNGKLGYNICPKAGSRRGVKATEEERRRMSERAMEAMNRPDVKLKIIAAAKARDRNYSEEYRAKLSAAAKRRVMTDEIRRKIGDGHRGRVVSESTKLKMREAWKRRKLRTSQEVESSAG